MKTFQLEELTGEHTLTGVFFDAQRGNTQVCIFTMDGVHYEAVEDPDDGYRSSLNHVAISETAPPQIAPIRVIGKMDECKRNDILQFVNPTTGKPVLEIGTADTDDYYPGYVAEFHPENA